MKHLIVGAGIMGRKSSQIRKQNEQFKWKIAPADAEIYDTGAAILRSDIRLSPVQQEQATHKLAQQILAAEQRGESVDELTGGNIYAFCKAITASMQVRPAAARIGTWIYRMMILLAIISGGVLVAGLISGNSAHTLPLAQFGIGFLAAWTALIVLSMVTLAMPYQMTFARWRTGKVHWSLWVVFFAIYFLLQLIPGQVTLSVIPFGILCAVTSVYAIIAYLFFE